MDAMIDDFNDLDLEDFAPRNCAQAWVQKIDKEHCSVTLGDFDIDSPKVQNRLTAMDAAGKSVEILGGSKMNIFNESWAIQIVFCITYRVAFFFQNLK